MNINKSDLNNIVVNIRSCNDQYEAVEELFQFIKDLFNKDDGEHCEICGCKLIIYEGFLRCADCEERQMIDKGI